MSDPKSSYGEPVDEPAAVDDVVGRANEGLAEAEAARGEDTAPSESAAPESSAPAAQTAEAPAPVASEPDPWDSPEAAALEYDRPAASDTAVSESAQATTAYEPVTPAAGGPAVTASEPAPDAYATEVYATEVYATPATAGAAAATTVAPTVLSPQPIFVQAPESPTPRGNRAAAGAIGLLAAVSFAVLYLGAWLGLRAIAGEVTGENVGTTALDALTTWELWVPVVIFFVAFWLLGAIINRGRWGAWVVFGLLVGVASYGGYLLGQLFQAPFWMLTATEGATLVEEHLFAPMAIVSFVIGRELTIWFGAWAASRGRRVTELNLEAQREYERTLEAGPTLVRQ